MVVGILQFELLIHGAQSLKDKRRVISSVKDRLHREHQVSVAEVARQELWTSGVLGLAVVGTDGRRVGQVLDAVTLKLRGLHDAELGDVTRQIVEGSAMEESAPVEDVSQAMIADEMLRRAQEGAA